MGLGTLSQPLSQRKVLTLLGVEVALEAEAKCLARGQGITENFIYMPEGILVRLSGIGPRRAGLAAKALLEKGVTALLSWGCAGGLHPRVSPGDLILPKTVIAADQSVFYTDLDWHRCLHACLKGHVDLHTDPLIESPSVLTNFDEKLALSHRYGAVAVDMESAAVARVACQAGVPFMAIRAVADPPDMSIPLSSLAAVDEHGRVCLPRFLKKLLWHPADLFPLIRLGMCFHSARVTLKKVAHLAGKDLVYCNRSQVASSENMLSSLVF